GGSDHGEAVLGLRQVLGVGLRFVHGPGDTLGLGLANGRPQPHKLLAGQEPLATVLLELFDPAGGVHAVGDNAATPREGIHAADDGEDAVSLERGRLELPVQPRDLRARDLVGLAGPKLRLDNLVQQVPVEGDSPRLALLLDVFGHEPVSQFRDCQSAPLGGFPPRRVLAMRHRSQNSLCTLSGGLWRGLADVCDGEAPHGSAAPSAGPVDHHVGHGPARSHANAETGKLGVPDGKFARTPLQAISDPLGNSKVSHGSPLLPEISPGEAPGKHRKGSPGHLPEIRYPENPHYKGISGNTGNARKPRELAVLRMAFKRSGVRLPLAPPASGSASQSYRFGRTVVRAVACARTAVACSRNAFTNRSRTEALGHMSPMRRAKERPLGTGSLASDKPSGHGGAQSGRRDTPSPRSTMTAIASNWSISKSSRGRIPALRR